MLSRKAVWGRGALACALFLISGLAAAGAQTSKTVATNTQATKIGIFFKYDASIPLGRALGVHYQRYILPVTGANGAHIARIREAEADGFKVNIDINNIAAGVAGARPGPVRDDRSFETELASILDATHPDLVTIQNEEDGLGFWTGTPEDYLHELTIAAQVSHAKGYRISNGGLTMTGLAMAYWHYLWRSGQRDLADRFAAVALTPEMTNNHVILGDIPDSSEPGRPILGHDSAMRAKLDRVEKLIAAYPRTGIDYMNIHWYESSPELMRAVVTWLTQTTHLPVICNEMGQFSNSPATVTALLSEAEALHLPYVFWFATDGRGRAVGMAEQDGTPRHDYAAAFKAFVAAHP